MSGTIYWKKLVVSLSAIPLLASCSSGPTSSGEQRNEPEQTLRRQHFDAYFDSDWAMRPLWEDGRAEIARYDAQRIINGQALPYELVQVTQLEEFNQQFDVRTDSLHRNDIFPVMHISQFGSLPTETPPFHFLTTLFFRRDRPTVLHKLTTSLQEPAGNTFKAFVDDDLQYVETYNSYHDGQGAGRRLLRHELLFEDALSYCLRSLKFKELPAFDVTIAEQQQTSSAVPPLLYQAHVAVADQAASDTLAASWRVTVVLDQQKRNVYWFAQDYPHLLLSQITWNGRWRRLKSVTRAPYGQQ
ncbi:hypothetical protein MUN82_09455 [Hymenobacter aerilatus]|uniref:Uncharacterized protein n=1 Tax=Hymenobacter aerilatus TaxID=2932251 RepID=A0A8T9T632_9BACT|nr:hypothetical protein [Hymenobacter aerilatus]UOR07309.1 hypothetical protein MUN82_09455 [Hymenobacter aerilatus]